jgi:hypothetical protein
MVATLASALEAFIRDTNTVASWIAAAGVDDESTIEYRSLGCGGSAPDVVGVRAAGTDDHAVRNDAEGGGTAAPATSRPGATVDGSVAVEFRRGLGVAAENGGVRR